MSEKKYTIDHEWLSIDGEETVFGITQFAQEQLGDIVFVEVPESGRQLAIGEEAAVIESVKAAGEIHMPVAAVVTTVNERLADDPELVNRDPEGEGWLFKARLDPAADLSDLMDEDAYRQFLDS